MKREKSTKEYRELRVRLLSAGYTLRSFALAHGHSPQTVYSAARGKRAGVKSVLICSQLERIANATKRVA